MLQFNSAPRSTRLQEAHMCRAPLVLIVDDAADNREAYAEYLRFCGFTTREAASGGQAIAIALKERPDVVLLDIRLPDMNGLEVSRQVRASESLQHTKVIAVSACAFPSDVSQALESGCHSFLQKPCLPDALVQEMNRLIQDQESTPPAS
jgi:two-component system, cell cycle response regulator DivK